jgi:predicted transposase/invertase (TIGR01784 family)
MLYGASKIITDNLDKGMEYGKIKKVISINIVYFDLGRGQDYIYHGTTNYQGLHKKDTLTLSVAEENIYHTLDIAKIYPEYYIIKVNQFDDVSKDTLDEWINFFKNQEVRENTKAKGLQAARVELDIMKLSPEEKLEYESYIAESRDNYGVIVGNYNKGKTEGKIEGRKEGKIEGKKEGKIEGKKEGQIERNIEIVKKLHEEGTSIPLASKITGLSEDEIKKIIAQH